MDNLRDYYAKYQGEIKLFLCVVFLVLLMVVLSHYTNEKDITNIIEIKTMQKLVDPYNQ